MIIYSKEDIIALLTIQRNKTSQYRLWVMEYFCKVYFLLGYIRSSSHSRKNQPRPKICHLPNILKNERDISKLVESMRFGKFLILELYS